MNENKICQLSIIIVNYKSVDLIKDCVQSIIAETKRIQYEIIVVDNNSGDQCDSRLKALFPDLRVVMLKENVGFSRANNAGMNVARSNIFLILNPDTIIINQALEKCFLEFEKLENYAACGVQLLNEDRSPQISGNYNMIGGINFLLALPYWGNVLRWFGYKFKSKIPHLAVSDKKEDVDWINGAYIMVKKSAVESAGYFDEEFFLYSEEIEWCARLKEVGKLCIFGDYNVIHLQGETVKAAYGNEEKGYYNFNDRKGLQLIVSGFLRIRKQFGFFWTIFTLLNFLWSIPFSFVLIIISKILKPKELIAKLTYISGFYKNILIFVFKYLGKILIRKKYFYKVM